MCIHGIYTSSNPEYEHFCTDQGDFTPENLCKDQNPEGSVYCIRLQLRKVLSHEQASLDSEAAKVYAALIFILQEHEHKGVSLHIDHLLS